MVCVCVPVLWRTGVIFWVDSCLRASNPYRILNYSVVDALTLQTQISRQTGFQRQKPWAGPTLTLWTQSQSDFLVQRNKKKQKKNIFPLRKIMFGLFLVCFCCFSDHLLLLFYLLFIYMALFTHKMQRTVLCTLKQIRAEDLIVCEPVTEKQQRRFPQCAHTRNCAALRRGSSTSARPRRRCSRRCHRFSRQRGFFVCFLLL